MFLPVLVLVAQLFPISREFFICYTSAYRRCNWIIVFRYWEAVTVWKWGCRASPEQYKALALYRVGNTVILAQEAAGTHSQSDPWPFLKQNVITTDMSSTLCATECLSFLPALGFCLSSVVLEKLQQQFTPAEPSRLSSSAAYWPNSPVHNPT